MATRLIPGRWTRSVMLGLGLWGLAHIGSAAEGVSYVYVELGRLVGVVDPAGDSVVYTYDAVGNLLSISRQSSSQPTILDFTPKTGPPGTNVTLQGTGFGATAGMNIVTSSGLHATVTS